MRNILVLFIATIFLLGTSSLEAQNRNGNKGQGKGCKGHCQCEKSATDRAENVASRLTKTLDLNNKQSEKVEAIYLDFFEERETYFKENKNGERPRKGKDGQGKGNRVPDAECVTRFEGLEADLSKVLTKDQMAEYDKVKEKRSNRANKSDRQMRNR